MDKAIEVKKMTAAMAVKITKEDIIKYFCPLATEKELFMALGIINSLKLNPFTREVHLIKYDIKSPISIVVGYEVYLKRAERTGQLAGWTAGINKEKNVAWVTIHRKDWKTPFEWEVDLSEFSKKQATWLQIPSFMGKKVAIAQGFRLAFPDELGGMPYTQEEQEIYDIEQTTPTTKSATEKPKSISESNAPEIEFPDRPITNSPEHFISDKQAKRLYAIYKGTGKTDDEVKQYLFEQYGITSSKEIPSGDVYEDICTWCGSPRVGE